MITLKQKQEILELILSELKGTLDVLVESALIAKEASTNEESKAENKYDTRGLEAGYLASGQAKRVQKLKEQIFLLEKMEPKSFSSDERISLSAIINISIDDEREALLFLLPVGGVEVDYQGQTYKSITLESPLGQNLIDQEVGYDFTLSNREYEVLELF